MTEKLKYLKNEEHCLCFSIPPRQGKSAKYWNQIVKYDKKIADYNTFIWYYGRHRNDD